MSHPSSSVPNQFIPEKHRLDLDMDDIHVIQTKSGPFSMGHLQTLMCDRQIIFKSSTTSNFFYNALRLRWKIQGRVHNTQEKITDDLIKFITLEFGRVFIIADLLTITAFGRLSNDATALNVLSMVIFDLYDEQWQHWLAANSKNLSHDHLVLAHAQNTTNQLSNFVLAFKNASPQLRAWAERITAEHVISIVAPGHMPTHRFGQSRQSAPTRTTISTDHVGRDPREVNDHDPSRRGLTSYKKRNVGVIDALSASISPLNKKARITPVVDTYRPSHSARGPCTAPSTGFCRTTGTTSPYFKNRRPSAILDGSKPLDFNTGARPQDLQAPMSSMAPMSPASMLVYQPHISASISGGHSTTDPSLGAGPRPSARVEIEGDQGPNPSFHNPVPTEGNSTVDDMKVVTKEDCDDAAAVEKEEDDADKVTSPVL